MQIILYINTVGFPVCMCLSLLIRLLVHLSYTHLPICVGVHRHQRVTILIFSLSIS